MITREQLEEKELSELKDIAEQLAIEFPKNIGKVKLIDKILKDEEETEGFTEGVKVVKKETPQQLKKRMNKLVRVRISPNSPQYKGRNGIALKIGNKTEVVGKFIPFDTVWHVQEPIIEVLKRRTFRETKFKTDTTTGLKVPVTKIHKAFVVEVLPNLTENELKKLATDQRVRGVITDDD